MLKTAYTDGAVRVSNPGVASCAWVLYDGDTEVAFDSDYLGDHYTNNFAEYMGLVFLLEYLYKHSIRNVIIHSDSELVVNQVNQNWTANDLNLRRAAANAYGLLTAGCHVLKHIKGHDGNKGNERADELCNQCLDAHKEEYEKSTE
jgi:ribonuclease HI